jgi:hypothetical protein
MGRDFPEDRKLQDVLAGATEELGCGCRIDKMFFLYILDRAVCAGIWGGILLQENTPRHAPEFPASRRGEQVQYTASEFCVQPI